MGHSYNWKRWLYFQAYVSLIDNMYYFIYNLYISLLLNFNYSYLLLIINKLKFF